MWTKISDDQEMKLLYGNLLIIKPINIKIVPLFCLCCSFPMKDINDSIAHKTFGCCQHCELNFARPYKDKWESGWRPNKSMEEFNIYIEKRRQQWKPIIQFK